MVKAAHKIILGDYLVIAKPWSYFFRSLLDYWVIKMQAVRAPEARRILKEYDANAGRSLDRQRDL